jgi:hypothetical protein
VGVHGKYSRRVCACSRSSIDGQANGDVAVFVTRQTTSARPPVAVPEGGMVASKEAARTSGVTLAWRSGGRRDGITTAYGGRIMRLI